MRIPDFLASCDASAMGPTIVSTLPDVPITDPCQKYAKTNVSLSHPTKRALKHTEQDVTSTRSNSIN